MTIVRVAIMIMAGVLVPAAAWRGAGGATVTDAVAAVSTPSWAPAGSYALTFDDEFDGTSLDASSWVVGGCDDPADVTVTGGSLQLSPTGTCTEVSVSSVQRFTKLGGSVEARVYLPATDGNATAEVTGAARAVGSETTTPLAGWHTFGSSWDSDDDTVTYYWDGVAAGTLPMASAGTDHVVFTDAVTVDWVRIWRQA